MPQSRVTLWQSRCFIAVPESGLVAAASRRPASAQGTVTMDLQKLEVDLDQRLFEPGSKGVTPTGQVLMMGGAGLPSTNGATVFCPAAAFLAGAACVAGAFFAGALFATDFLAGMVFVLAETRRRTVSEVRTGGNPVKS